MQIKSIEKNKFFIFCRNFKTTIYRQTVTNNYLLRCVITGSTGILVFCILYVNHKSICMFFPSYHRALWLTIHINTWIVNNVCDHINYHVLHCHCISRGRDASPAIYNNYNFNMNKKGECPIRQKSLFYVIFTSHILSQ